MKRVHLTFSLLFFIAGSFSASAFQTKLSNQLPWSERIAKSFISMHPDSITYSTEEKSKRWNYEQGLMLETFYQIWKHTNDSTYLRYARKNLDYYITDDGSIKTYELGEFNIDNVTPGKAVLRMFSITHNPKYKKAADTLRKQLSQHPRTISDGFWHKKIYPNQMWLDGLYMGEPFYAYYSSMFNDTTAFNDIAKQFLLIAKNNYDPKTGLYFHAWDESKKQRWADSISGCSPNIWGRSLGWYAMALVDVLEMFPQEHRQRKELEKIFQNLAVNILKQRDERSKLWFQVVDKQNAVGNYLEASASAMFTYAFAKGVRLEILPKNFEQEARVSFQGILDSLVKIDLKGIVHLTNVCRVAGLGGNPYRDGSYSYYINEPKRTDDFKGYGPFLLAAIELEKLTSKK